MSINLNPEKNNFAAAVWGPDVRGSMVSMAEKIETAVNNAITNQLLFIDDGSLTEGGKAADAAVAGERFKRDELALNLSEQAGIAFGRVDTTGADWQLGYYVDDNDGKIKPQSGSASVASTAKLLHIPHGCVVKIHAFIGTKIAKFDSNGNKISVTSYSGNNDVNITDSDAKYIRLQCALVSSEDTVAAIVARIHVRYEYATGKNIHEEDVQDNIGNSVESTVSASSTTSDTLVLNDTSDEKFKDLTVGISSSNYPTVKDVLTVSGKNLVNFYDYANANPCYFTGGITTYGVHLDFAAVGGLFHIYCSNPNHDVLALTSAAFGTKYQTVNGNSFNHNFKFKFKDDTVVTVSDNCSQHVPFNFGVEMRVTSDGSSWMPVSGAGLTFTAAANTEYAIYFVVRAGWTGDVYYRPQVEIGSHPTAFEPFDGYTLFTNDAENNSKFNIAAADSSVYNNTTKNYDVVFDATNDEVHIKCSPHSDAMRVLTPVTHPESDDEEQHIYADRVNSVRWNYICKFTGDGSWVLVEGVPKKYKGQLYGQIGDGTSSWADIGDGVLLYTVPGREYGYRLWLAPGAEFEDTIKPVIVRGAAAALYHARSRKGMTVLQMSYGGDFPASFSATAYKASRSNMIDESYKVAKNVNIITGGLINGEPFPRRPMVSFIDDDATNSTFVEEYHDLCAAKGIVGGYAIETDHIDTEGDTLKNMLLGYEQEGFACLYHCRIQNSNTMYWIEGQNGDYDGSAYDEDAVRANFVYGLRRMAAFGFSNYKYWVTPYGVNSKFMQDLAKNHGMKCLVSYPSKEYFYNSFVSRYGNVGKWDIPRLHYEFNTSDDRAHLIIDSCAADNGWMIITTHVNSWPTGDDRDAMHTKFSNLIQYVKDAGVDIVSFPTAFETFKPVLDMRDLLK